MILNRPSLRAALLLPLVAAQLLSGLAGAAEPPERTQGEIRYMTGGVGQEESQALRAAASRFSLAMTFTAETGQYLSDVQVAIRNRAGDPVFETVSEGPMVLVNLPAGAYTVAATSEGRTLTKKITLGRNGHRRLVMRWPADSRSRS